MNHQRFFALERGERRKAIVRLTLRVLAIIAVLLIAYYLLPPWKLAAGRAVVGLLVSALLFGFVVAWLLRRIMRADLPGLRAVEALAVIVPLFLYLFASLYLAMSQSTAGAFSEPLNHTGALYFTVTTFASVGFGDVTPKTDLARIVVGMQMLLDLVVLGAVVRLVIGAARHGQSREL